MAASPSKTGPEAQDSEVRLILCTTHFTDCCAASRAFVVLVLHGVQQNWP